MSDEREAGRLEGLREALDMANMLRDATKGSDLHSNGQRRMATRIATGLQCLLLNAGPRLIVINDEPRFDRDGRFGG